MHVWRSRPQLWLNFSVVYKKAKATGEGAGATRAWVSQTDGKFENEIPTISRSIRKTIKLNSKRIVWHSRPRLWLLSFFPKPLVIFRPCNQASPDWILSDISNLLFQSLAMTDYMVKRFILPECPSSF